MLHKNAAQLWILPEVQRGQGLVKKKLKNLISTPQNFNLLPTNRFFLNIVHPSQRAGTYDICGKKHLYCDDEIEESSDLIYYIGLVNSTHEIILREQLAQEGC